MQREAVAHLTAMDMTMKCHHSSIKNLPLCLTTRLKEQRKKGLPCRPQRAGRSNVFSTGKTTCRKGGCNGITQSGKPNAVGTEDEQSAKRRYGNRIKRAYLPLKLHKKGRCQQTAAFLISGVI